jgi:hypothetical protein
MLKKVIPFTILVLAVTAVLIFRNSSGNHSAQRTTTSHTDPSQEVNRDHGFNRRVSDLEYTKHAKCRMDCRHITQAEVQEILQNGTINYRKSNENDRPCPTYAVEGTTLENQRLRIVFAQCDNTTKVVTCIELGKEWECHCPGDENK